ncbi:SpoIIE family protein phosphatase [Streptomyces sp. NPDC056367]|uniref:SpoIIE family protein phosphatase n=1 Tax=Streptomyces sp. NPDC056367 TaxID=3345797 RepID=UPI0035D9D1A9
MVGRPSPKTSPPPAWPDAESIAVLDGLFGQSPIGIAVYDTELRLVRVNPALERLSGTPAERLLGKRVHELLAGAEADAVEERLRTVLRTGRPLVAVEHHGHTPADPERRRAWSVSSFRLAAPSGRVLGVACAVVDITERHLAGRRVALLSEAGARIGSTLDVTRSAEELTEVMVPESADFIAVDLLAGVDVGEEPPPGPVPGAAVLRRAAIRSVLARAPEATYPVGALITYHPDTPQARCMTTGVPRLIPVLAEDADWLAHYSERAAKILEAGVHSVMTLPLRARDVTLGLVHLYRWQRPDAFGEDDLALAVELAARAALCLDNARRYTREHQGVLTLQSGLLQSGAPDPGALEVAHRYLPAQAHAGVAGDWFDVIPLSGARIGLAVGDVTGRGLVAVTRAARLRTAVRALAVMDLTPDELLTRLDELMQRAQQFQQVDGDPAEVFATCLYAVYDPVSGRCSAASAGHPPPAVVRPGGPAELLRMPVGLPLGLGGLPFEAIDVDLPDGSFLALFTDGLVRSRAGDIDSSLSRLRQALARPDTQLDTLAQSAVDAVMPNHAPEDDAVLLLARTRLLSRDRVATWDLPSEPVIVAKARAMTERQLGAWHLEDMAFTTELIVSELVTNAIRYGRPPIRLRLIRERSLICEVSDTSSTSPHLRHAATTDEGGRGLFMIARLADTWGTRYTPTGKTIWAGQTATPDAAPS